MKRTRGTDETLFPDLEIGGDYCLDVKCWEKEWAKSIERAYKKFEQANENVSELPILYSGKSETVFPASLLGEGRIKLGDRWHEIIKESQVFTIESWQRDYEKPSKLREAATNYLKFSKPLATNKRSDLAFTTSTAHVCQVSRRSSLRSKLYLKSCQKSNSGSTQIVA